MKLAKKTYGTPFLSLLFAIAISLAPLTASAQSSWRVDPEHSIARLSLGAGEQTLEAGVARTGGSAVFNPADPASAHFDLTILSDDSRAAQHSEMTFNSKHSQLNADGSLSVTGDLTVTRVLRPVYVDPNEGYSGAQYGEPVFYSSTSEATLVFADVKSALNNDGVVHLAASTVVYSEDFPQLPTALQAGDWPSSLVQDREAKAPATVGEGYAGFETAGTPVFTATNSVTTSSGEGYYGAEPATAPDTRKATIAFDLKLTQSTSPQSDTTLSSGN